MKLIIYNGSPRGVKGNSKILADQFLNGIQSAGNFDIELYYLAKKSDRAKGAERFPEADRVILVFPLYTDAMPGIVKEFIEMLKPYRGNSGNPAMGFIVHSGFPEPAHSRYLQLYLERLTIRMQSEYVGTAVKGGSEGVRLMPAWMTRKLRNRLFLLGRSFATSGKFDEKILMKLAPWEHFTRWRIFVFRLMQKLNLNNMYWNSQLKQNSVWERRFDRPYSLKP